MKGHPKRPRKKRKGSLYTTDEFNELIDSLCHPLAKVDRGFILVNGILARALVEQNPPASVNKFVKFSLPHLIKQLEKEAKKQITGRGP